MPTEWLLEGRRWVVTLALNKVVSVKEYTFKLTGPAECTETPVGKERIFPDIQIAFATLHEENKDMNK